MSAGDRLADMLKTPNLFPGACQCPACAMWRADNEKRAAANNAKLERELLAAAGSADPDAFVVGSGSTRCRIPFAAIASIDDSLPRGGNAITVRLGGGPSDRRETFCNSVADRFRSEYAAWQKRQPKPIATAASDPGVFVPSDASPAFRFGDVASSFARPRGAVVNFTGGGHSYIPHSDVDRMIAELASWRERQAKPEPIPETIGVGTEGFGYLDRGDDWNEYLDFADVIDEPALYDAGLYSIRMRFDGDVATHRFTPAQFAAFAAGFLAWKSRPKPELEPASDPDVFTYPMGAAFRFDEIAEVTPRPGDPDMIDVTLRSGRRYPLASQRSRPRFEREYAAWKSRQAKAAASQPTRDGWHWYRSRPEAPWRLCHVFDIYVRGAWIPARHTKFSNHRGEWRPVSDTTSATFIQAATDPGGATNNPDPR